MNEAFDRQIIRMMTNENPLGSPPQVAERLLNDCDRIYRYPDPDPVALREKLARKLDLCVDNICISAGSVALIDNIIQTLVEQDEEVLTFERSFVAYGLLAEWHRRKCRFAPQNRFTCHIESLLPLVNEKTGVIFLANPNNPTSTCISHSEVVELLDHVPSHVLVVLDEAYHEYVTATDYPDNIALQKKYPNLFVLRSFSKIYGLAGLRIGYGYGNVSVIEKLNRHRLPYSINTLSVKAAKIALEDENFVLKSKAFNSRQRELLYNSLNDLGFHVMPPQGNFIYLLFPVEPEKEWVYEKLRESGIYVCNLKSFGQDKSLRISVGLDKDNRYLIEKFKTFSESIVH